jgi:hypothetical protein
LIPDRRNVSSSGGCKFSAGPNCSTYVRTSCPQFACAGDFRLGTLFQLLLYGDDPFQTAFARSFESPPGRPLQCATRTEPDPLSRRVNRSGGNRGSRPRADIVANIKLSRWRSREATEVSSDQALLLS